MPPTPSEDARGFVPPIVSVKLVQQSAIIYSSHISFPQTSELRELVYCRSKKSITIKPAGTIPEESGPDYAPLPAELLITGVPMSTVQHIESIRSHSQVLTTPPYFGSVVLSESTLRLSSPTDTLHLTLTNRSRVYMEKPAVELQAIILDSSISLDAKYTNGISISGPGTQACSAIVTRKVADANTACYLGGEALDNALARLYSTAIQPSTSSDSWCIICFEALATVGMNGCGHLVICGHCLPKAIQNGLVAEAKCPVCRSLDPPRTNTLHIRQQQQQQQQPTPSITATTSGSVSVGIVHRAG